MKWTITSLCTVALLAMTVIANAATITPGNLQGWAPANVRNTGTVAILATYPNATNGSLRFTQLGSADKADFELDNGNPCGYGLVKDITHVGYEFYRNASSTAAGFLAPVLRLGVYDPASGKSSLLIYEPVYNSYPASVPTSSWTTIDATGANWWMRALGSSACTYEAYDVTLAEWVSGLNNGSPMGAYLGCTPNPVGPLAWVYAINVGIGSGWTGTFDGAADNVTLAFNGQSTTYDFELDPASELRNRSWGHIKAIYR